MNCYKIINMCLFRDSWIFISRQNILVAFNPWRKPMPREYKEFSWNVTKYLLTSNIFGPFILVKMLSKLFTVFNKLLRVAQQIIGIIWITNIYLYLVICVSISSPRYSSPSHPFPSTNSRRPFSTAFWGAPVREFDTSCVKKHP